jgi:peptide/nickel transport system substrate-binding protein
MPPRRSRVPARSMAIGVSIVAVALAACTASTPLTSADDRSARAGGTLELTMIADDFEPSVAGAHFVTLDPTRETTSMGLGFLRCCLARTLMSYDTRPGRRGALVPDLAIAPPAISEDGLRWTFHLRADLRYAPPFADTSIVSGDIVRALLRAAAQPAEALYPSYFTPIVGFQAVRDGDAASISGLETPDEHTIVIHLNQPIGDLGDRLALPTAAPIPSTAAGVLGAATGHDSDYGGYLVSSGPYMYEGSPSERIGPDAPAAALDLSSSTSITLVRNPSWDPQTDPIRAAFVDRIHVEIGGDYSSNAAEVDRGAADLQYEAGTTTPPATLDRYESDPGLSARLVSWDTPGVEFVTMNLAVPPFDDLNLRRAVAFAVNTRELVRERRTLASRFGDIQTGRLARHIAPDSLEGDLLADFDPFRGRSGAERRARANAAMAMSRYDQDRDGRCDALACRSVSLFAYRTPAVRAIAETLRRDLHPIGIELEPRFLGRTFGSVFVDPSVHAPMVVGLGWVSDYPNASTFFQPLLSGAAIHPAFNEDLSMVGASPAQLDLFGYHVASVPSIDDRINACLPLTGEQQTQCWALLDKYVMIEVVPWVPFFTSTFVVVTSSRVRGLEQDPLSTGPALEQLWLVSPAASPS